MSPTTELRWVFVLHSTGPTPAKRGSKMVRFPDLKKRATPHELGVVGSADFLVPAWFQPEAPPQACLVVCFG